MILAAFTLLCAMSSADAVAVLLNSPNATGPRTFAEAKRIVERDAEEGKPLQQFVLGVTTDDKKAAKRHLDASRDKIRMFAEERNNPLAWYLLSVESNDFEMLQKAADGGNVQALNALGSITVTEAFKLTGVATNGIDRILKKGYECFRKATEQGDANGFINLGTCYLRGFGCKQDQVLAFECFKSAAEKGHPEGMDNMSAAYQFGHGVKQSDELSLYWAMRGRAARGNEAAAQWLRDRK